MWKIRQVMAAFPRDYQILVANDASSDKTAAVLAPYQGVLPLSVLNLDRRHGYACALELLLREAARRAEYPKRDVIVTLQADFSDDPEHLTAMLKRVEAGADVVCLNADLPEKAARAARWARRIGKSLLGRRRWPDGVNDPLSGFRAYRVYTIRKAIEQRGSGRLLTWDGAAANAELLSQVLPHARRTDAFEATIRSDRQQRPTRQTFWTVVGPLLRLATGGSGPYQGLAQESAPWVAAEVRKRERPTHQEPAERTRESRGNGEKAARRRPGQASRRPRAEGEEKTRRPAAKRRGRPQPAQNGNESAQLEVVPVEAASGEPARKKKRRRRRRSGAGARPQTEGAPTLEMSEGEGPEAPLSGVAAEGETAEAANGERKRRRNRRGRGRRGRRGGSNTKPENGVSVSGAENSAAGETTPPPEPAQPYLETGTD